MNNIDGTNAHGEKVTVRPKIAPDQAFPVKVAAFEPGKRMVWRGGAPLKFIFKGERTFTLTPAADGATEFTMHEAFTGLFSPLITKSIPDLQPAFEEFAACLKKARRVLNHLFEEATTMATAKKTAAKKATAKKAPAATKKAAPRAAGKRQAARARARARGR